MSWVPASTAGGSWAARTIAGTWTAAPGPSITWGYASYYFLPNFYIDQGYIAPNGEFANAWDSPADTTEVWS